MIAENQGNMGADLLVDETRFLVHHVDFVSLGYYFRGAANKPFLATLVGPSGRNMVDAQPADHAHHRGIWWGHGDVDGVDYYLEVPKADHPAGTIEHVEFDEIVDDRPRFGFVERLEWRDHEQVTVIEERRSLLANFADDDHYTVDLDSSYTATRGLEFGDTKESVMPGIRLAERLTVNGGATMRNSRGQFGEPEVMGQPAEWIDCSVHRSGLWWNEVTEGIACFDHPANEHHPTVWFARNYGPVSPFEGHHFLGGGAMAAGETFRLRHRILVHAGDADEGDVPGAYASYCAAPLSSPLSG